MRTFDAVQTAQELSRSTTSLVLLVMADRPTNNKHGDHMVDMLSRIFGQDEDNMLLRSGSIMQVGDIGSQEDLATTREAFDDLINLTEDEPHVPVEVFLFSHGHITGYARASSRYPAPTGLQVPQRLLDELSTPKLAA